MEENRINEILNYYNEFTLLTRYKNIPLADLDSFVGQDLICVREYLKTTEGGNDPKAYNFEDFLKQFKFYVQGGGHPFPSRFSDYRWHVNQKLLSEEMIRVYCEIFEKANGEETARDKH